MTVPIYIQEQLAHPVDPEGRPIAWTHPFLVFLAEHGRIPANEAHELECVELIRTGRAVSKSTSMAARRRVLPSGLVLPEPRPRREYMLEFFAYETVGVGVPPLHGHGGQDATQDADRPVRV